MPSERKTITIQAFTEVKTSAKGRQYWTLQDMEQTKYVCFIVALRDHCHLGAKIDAELEPPRTPGDSGRLANIYEDGKPIYQAEKRTGATQRTYGKSNEELKQIKELANAQNRSIQAQTALNRAVDLAISENSSILATIKDIKETAKEFYLLLQWLMEGEVEIKTIPEVQQSKEDIAGKGWQPSSDKDSPQVDEPPQEIPVKDVKTAKELEIPDFANMGEFFMWCKSHYPQKQPSWIKAQINLSTQPTTQELKRAAIIITQRV